MTRRPSHGHVSLGDAEHAMLEACAWLLYCRPTSAEWASVTEGLRAWFVRRFGVTR